MRLKTVRVPRGYDGLHCEVDGCLVNIQTNLHDEQGRPVTRIDIRADRYAGEAPWTVLLPLAEPPYVHECEAAGIRVRRADSETDRQLIRQDQETD